MDSKLLQKLSELQLSIDLLYTHVQQEKRKGHLLEDEINSTKKEIAKVEEEILKATGQKNYLLQTLRTVEMHNKETRALLQESQEEIRNLESAAIAELLHGKNRLTTMLEMSRNGSDRMRKMIACLSTSLSHGTIRQSGFYGEQKETVQENQKKNENFEEPLKVTKNMGSKRSGLEWRTELSSLIGEFQEIATSVGIDPEDLAIFDYFEFPLCLACHKGPLSSLLEHDPTALLEHPEYSPTKILWNGSSLYEAEDEMGEKTRPCLPTTASDATAWKVDTQIINN